MKILVLNCGSSSLKFQLIDMNDESIIAKGACERIAIEGSKITYKPTNKASKEYETPLPDHGVAVNLVLQNLMDKENGVISDISEIAAVGHRVLHGGQYYSESVLVNEDVKKVIRDCFDLGPLHNPANLTGIEACEKVMGDIPQVAVFDTAFHQTMPQKAYMYAIPYEYYEKYRIRKYGFHGTSHRYVSKRAAEFLGLDSKGLKVVTCHLGNGSSLAAVKDGKCVDTTMGFTPLAGVCMGTRSGDIDPAIVEFICKKENLSVSEVLEILNKKSGVYAVSGVSSDFRDLENPDMPNPERRQLALDMFIYQVQKQIGAAAAAMGGIDVLVFTAGVGENTGYVREEVCKNLKFLGVEIDSELNKARGVELDISAKGASVKTVIIPTNEELTIARDTKEIVEKI